LLPRHRDSATIGTIIPTDERVKTTHKSKNIPSWVLTLTILGFTRVFPFTQSIK